ncbi:MAG: hypothetical protein Q4A71_00915 [Actinomycetaceae bacterium]|nr:hypothetical protein [Actinomycetaceae bacterium]
MKKVIIATVVVAGLCAYPPFRSRISALATKFGEYYVSAEREITAKVLTEVSDSFPGRHASTYPRG